MATVVEVGYQDTAHMDPVTGVVQDSIVAYLGSRRQVLGLADKADPKACSYTFSLYPLSFSLTFFCVAYSSEVIVHLLQEQFNLKAWTA